MNLRNFIAAHREAERYFLHHSTTKRGAGWSMHGGKIDGYMLDDMAERSALSLLATNATARIEFAKAMQRRVSREIPVSRENPAFFVTLAPANFVMSRVDAFEFDWSELEAWAKPILTGFDYFGHIDIALFLNTPQGRQKAVSWHLHLIVWNTTEKRLRRALKPVEAQHESFLPGRTVVHIRSLFSPTGLSSRTFYLMKAPLRTYRCRPLIPTGRLMPVEWQSRKDTSRIGQAIDAARVLRGARIPSLCLAGGAGEKLLRGIERRTLIRVERRIVKYLRRMLKRCAAPSYSKFRKHGTI